MKTSKTNLIIVTDLGLLRAYRVVRGEMGRHPHLEQVEEFRCDLAHQRLGEQVSDRPGRFQKGAGRADVPGDLSSGERHDYELEQRRRFIERMAGRIDALLTDDGVGSCLLAASAPIHLQLLEQLDSSARAKVKQTLSLDLTKTNPAELLGRFKQ